VAAEWQPGVLHLQGTPCGFPDARSIQLLSKLLRERPRGGQPLPHRDRLIYIRRSGLRRFAVEAPLEFVLRAVAERHALNYTVVVVVVVILNSRFNHAS